MDALRDGATPSLSWPGRPLNQPERGVYHTTRLGAEHQGD